MKVYERVAMLHSAVSSLTRVDWVVDLLAVLLLGVVLVTSASPGSSVRRKLNVVLNLGFLFEEVPHILDFLVVLYLS